MELMSFLLPALLILAGSLAFIVVDIRRRAREAAASDAVLLSDASALPYLLLGLLIPIVVLPLYLSRTRTRTRTRTRSSTRLGAARTVLGLVVIALVLLWTVPFLGSVASNA